MEEVFQAGCTVIYVSHATNSINEICSRAILLDRGELILDGPPRLITTYYQRMLFDESYPDEKIRREILELNRDQAAKEAFFREIQHIQPEDVADYYQTHYQAKGLNPESQNLPEGLDETIVKLLRKKKAEEAYDEWIKKLRQNYTIEINRTLWNKLAGS